MPFAENSISPDGGRPSVLVVDDEGPVRDLLCRWLADADCDCESAASADAALASLERRPVALVTLDINLPGVSGIELLPRIKETFLDTEVIMLTGRGDAHSAIAALSSGASGYLIKPVSPEELLFQARRCLERRQLLIDNRNYTQQLEARVHEQTMEIRQAHEETIHRLVTAASLRDEETGAHIRRVGLFSELLAEAVGWPSDAAEQLRMAAPMHDVGKIGIPDAILRKPGKLTDEEYEIMKQHTVIGGEILAASRTPVLRLAHDIALAHHERWDGKGYPKGLSGDAIAEAARIVSLVDVYDALTHDRVYRPAFARDKVLEMMEAGAGTQFDPFLYRLFASLEPELHRINAENPDEIKEDLLAVLPSARDAGSHKKIVRPVTA